MKQNIPISGFIAFLFLLLLSCTKRKEQKNEITINSYEGYAYTYSRHYADSSSAVVEEYDTIPLTITAKITTDSIFFSSSNPSLAENHSFLLTDSLGQNNRYTNRTNYRMPVTYQLLLDSIHYYKAFYAPTGPDAFSIKFEGKLN